MSKSIYIPPRLLDCIKRQAVSENRSVSNFIQTAVCDYLKRNGHKHLPHGGK